MKPTVPETARVISVDGDMAVVLLDSAKACKGCGAAAMGLCKPSGSVPVMTVRNTKNAVPGDVVTITLDKQTQRKGFLLAYFIPVASLIGGALLGYAADGYFGVVSLDVISGFTLLLLSSVITLQKLKKLNGSSFLTIKQIVDEYHFQDGRRLRPHDEQEMSSQTSSPCSPRSPQ